MEIIIMFYRLYQITQKVSKIIELKNKQLVSCSYDSSFIVYYKENNELCYSEVTNNAICFFLIYYKEKK